MSSEWEFSELGKVAINASRPFDFKKNPDVCFVNTGDVLNGEFLHSDISSGVGLPGQAKKSIKKNDILLTEIRPGNGRYAYVDFEAHNYVVSTKFMVIQCAELVNSRFLYHILKSRATLDDFQRIAESRSGTFPQITFDSIAHFPVPTPPKEEQERLVYFLDSLDERITLLRETNATLEAMAQALFKSWFVDFDPVHTKQQGRVLEGMDAQTAALFPDSFEDSELGMVPKGWRVSAVEDFAERVGMGPFGSNIKVETFVDAGIPIISGQHLKQYLVEDNTFNFITEEHAARLEKSCVHEGDVIFTHAGSIGQVSLLHKDSAFGFYVLSQRQFFLRCRKELMSPEWIVLYFKSPKGQHQLLANTSQVGVPSIARPVSYLRSIRLITPPPELNHRFASIAASINDRVMANRKQLSTLSDIRDTLLPRLISGQLRLPEAQALLEEAVIS